MKAMEKLDTDRLKLYLECGRSATKTAEKLGINRRNVDKWVRKAKKYGWIQEDEISQAANATGITDTRNISHFWKITKDEHGCGYSVFVKNPDSGTEVNFMQMVRDTIDESFKDKIPKYPKRKKVVGEYLLTIDLADVHFRKLCVKTETGYEYNRDVARHRVVEGTKELLKVTELYSVSRILFVLGNDVLHTDAGKPQTTSGTPQDTEGTPFQAYSDAYKAIVEAIELCAEKADVDLLHCMSNHDWFAGWALSQQVATHFSKHPNVHATDYSLSEAHRKYYRFGNNLFGLTHGDGAKEEQLYGLMVTEARPHVGECQNLYFLLHHLHHKIRTSRGNGKPLLREKDHNGMTAIISGTPQAEGDYLNIEYVRSPSPPDGWHDRNGFVNRQGVECFLFHETDGQKLRFTEWF